MMAELTPPGFDNMVHFVYFLCRSLVTDSVCSSSDSSGFQIGPLR